PGRRRGRPAVRGGEPGPEHLRRAGLHRPLPHRQARAGMAAHREGHLHRQSAGAGRRHRPRRGVRRSRPDRGLREGREMTTTQNTAPAKPPRWPAAPRRGRPRLTADLPLRSALAFPALIYMSAFSGYPIITTVALSFQAYDFTTFFNGHAPFIGFDTSAAPFSYPIFRRALG